MALASKPLARPIGRAAPIPQAVPRRELVNTAELVRGRVYWYKDTEFKKGEPQVVTDAMADILEALHQDVKDRDGETFEKPFFEVKRGVPKPAPKVEEKRAVRRLPAR